MLDLFVTPAHKSYHPPLGGVFQDSKGLEMHALIHSYYSEVEKYDQI
jgi:hypothetical protein